jgi:aryl-alcohol dehydrogenase-like predicted oxidoreductase
MITRQLFGRTGHESTRAIFGAAALSEVKQEEADRLLEVLMRYGVNHIDVAASYGDAELRVAPWLRRYPEQFFVATKTDGRTYEDAKRDIHRSLKRLGLEQVDLVQLHNLVDPIDWDTALSPRGALDACIEAREQGLVRFIGITGHGSQVAATHLRSLERFEFDTVMLPYNYLMMQDGHYADTFNRLAAVCEERNVVVQTIKAIARRPWWGREHTCATWYEPFNEPRDIDVAVHWAMARPGVFLTTAGDIHLAAKVLDAADRFLTTPSDEALEELTSRLDAIPLFA